MFPFTNPYRGYPPPLNKDYAQAQSSRFDRTSQRPTAQKFWLKAAIQDLDLTINQKHVVSFSLTIAKNPSTTTRTPAKMSRSNPTPFQVPLLGQYRLVSLFFRSSHLCMKRVLSLTIPTQPTPIKRSRGAAETLADTIKWKKYDFTLETAESNGPIYPVEQVREDLIKVCFFNTSLSIPDGQPIFPCILSHWKTRKHLLTLGFYF